MNEFCDKLKNYGLEFFGLYYGTYKAKVMSNTDPNNRGRLAIWCPQVHGPVSAQVWAEHKSPYAGNNFGFWAVPDVDEWVYVTFDHGRAEFPIWDGGWYANAEPTVDMVNSKVCLVTKEGMKIVIDRQAATILVDSGNGSSVTLSANTLALVSTNVTARNAGEAMALVNQTFLTWFLNSAYPWMVSKGYIGPPVPPTSATTVLKAE
jgi:phage baseplate assembly protein gpV